MTSGLGSASELNFNIDVVVLYYRINTPNFTQALASVLEKKNKSEV